MRCSAANSKGKERDSETRIDYAFARYYSSRLCRFLSTDPLSGTMGNPQSLNRYAYVLNNTLNLIAPGIAGETRSPSLNPAAYISLGSTAGSRLSPAASKENPTNRERLHVQIGSDGSGNDPFKKGIPAGTISALFKVPGAAPVIETRHVDTTTGQEYTIVDKKNYLDDPQVHALMNLYSLPGMINEVSLGETLYLYENQLKGSLAEFGNDALGGPDFSPVGSWFSPGDAGAFGGNFNSALPISIPNPFGPIVPNFPGAPPWCDAWCRF
jgi:RHS repeat-associated protein